MGCALVLGGDRLADDIICRPGKGGASNARPEPPDRQSGMGAGCAGVFFCCFNRRFLEAIPNAAVSDGQETAAFLERIAKPFLRDAANGRADIPGIKAALELG